MRIILGKVFDHVMLLTAKLTHSHKLPSLDMIIAI
jgi:hypothetical protein